MIDKKKKTLDMQLAESFKALAREIPVEKITIKQITDGAGVIRPTFYNHFEDKYQLLEWIIVNDLLLPIQPLVDNGMINEAILLIFHNMTRDRDFYMQISRLEGQYSFRGMVEKGIQLILCNLLEDKMQGMQPTNPWLTPQRLSEYYSQTLAYVMYSWVSSGMTLTPEQLWEVYDFVITRSPADLLDDITEWGKEISLTDTLLPDSGRYVY